MSVASTPFYVRRGGELPPSIGVVVQKQASHRDIHIAGVDGVPDVGVLCQPATNHLMNVALHHTHVHWLKGSKAGR